MDQHEKIVGIKNSSIIKKWFEKNRTVQGAGHKDFIVGCWNLRLSECLVPKTMCLQPVLMVKHEANLFYDLKLHSPPILQLDSKTSTSSNNMKG